MYGVLQTSSRFLYYFEQKHAVLCDFIKEFS